MQFFIENLRVDCIQVKLDCQGLLNFDMLATTSKMYILGVHKLHH